MYRLILLFISVIVSCLSHAQTTNPDMTAFGYKLGEKLSIPECPCSIVESKTEGSHGVFSIKHFQGYQYTAGAFTPVNSTCFERLDIEKYKVRKNEPLDPLPAFTNGGIKVRFASTDAPPRNLCPLGSFNAKIEDAKLVAVSFVIYTGDANGIFETLKKKYGTNVVVTPNKIQNGYGASLDYYTAVWALSNLAVVLESSSHTSIADQFGNVTIFIPAKVDKPKNERAL